MWRLSTNFCLDRQIKSGPIYSTRLFLFFEHVVTTLQNWEDSPFGRHLKEDLDNLPPTKRKEYIHGLKTFRQLPYNAVKMLCFMYNEACRSRAQVEELVEDLPRPSPFFMHPMEHFLLSNFPCKMFDLEAPQ